ncbi:hypothetical protein MKW98_000260 [Papaver atlanticum]|uniref:Uncharacterized protein n=1 Tax=Papaver atlanticum TaxID=357466 RepID=A0AAD4S065_9MAGN|nr:hypothetical protein MKW98_000260 [Papaver atlanticum]
MDLVCCSGGRRKWRRWPRTRSCRGSELFAVIMEGGNDGSAENGLEASIAFPSTLDFAYFSMLLGITFRVRVLNIKFNAGKALQSLILIVDHSLSVAKWWSRQFIHVWLS